MKDLISWHISSGKQNYGISVARMHFNSNLIQTMKIGAQVESTHTDLKTYITWKKKSDDFNFGQN